MLTKSRIATCIVDHSRSQSITGAPPIDQCHSILSEHYPDADVSYKDNGEKLVEAISSASPKVNCQRITFSDGSCKESPQY